MSLNMLHVFLFLNVWVCVQSDILTGLGNNLFGHKCSYFWRFKNISMPTNQLMTVRNFNNTGAFHAVHFSYISRHAARYPATDDFVYFDQLKAKILSHATNINNFNFLNNWQNYPPKEHAHVEELGLWEQRYLGNYYGSGLYNLFHSRISPTTIRLTATSKRRTRTSSKEFYRALSERTTGTGLTDIKPKENDTMLRYWEACPKYESMILNNKTYMREQYAFQNSSYFQKVIRNVSARLGMASPLSINDVKEMFMLCATDLAVRNNTDWCTLQTEEQREILNYEQDLEDYYAVFYGHPFLQKLTCGLWQDLFTSFENATSSIALKQEYVIGNIRFGHADTIYTFYSALGIYRDPQALKADNFEAMKNRIFYGSKLSPFSAQVAFILYNCGGGGPENYLIKMMVNGQPKIIPGCSQELCSYQDFKARYRHYTENCDHARLCELSTSQIWG